MTRWLAACLVALGLALHPGIAAAGAARAVVAVQGVDGDERTAVEDAAADWLVARKPPLVPMVDSELVCEDDACLLEAVAARKARAALQILVAEVQGRRLLVVRLLTRKGTVREGSARLDAGADLARQLGPLLSKTFSTLTPSAKAPPPGGSDPTINDDGSEGGPWYTQWWVWGVVAIMAGAAVVIGIQASQGGGRDEAVLDITGPSPASLLPSEASE